MVKLQGILFPFLSLSILGFVQSSQAAKISQSPLIGSQPKPSAQTPSAEAYCKSGDLGFLEQGLLPKTTTAPEALPQQVPLALPHQPTAVTLQTTLSPTISAAIRLAFERNPDLQAVRLQFQRSCAQLKQAEASRWPTLQVNGTLSYLNSSSFTPQGRTYSTSGGSSVQSSVSSTLQLQQSTALQQLQQNIQLLQSRFQQTPTQVQTSTIQQQLRQIQQRSSNSAVLPTTLNLTPLNAGSVALPLTPGTSASGDGSFFNGSLGLNYAIYTGGQRDASIQSAQRQVENAVLAVQLQLQQIRQSVTTSYYNLQQTQALIAIANSAVQNLQENFRVIQLGEKAGIQTYFAVLQAAVSLADAVQNQTQATSLYTIARRQLVQQLNLPDTVDVILPTTATPDKAGTWSLSLEKTIVLALNNRVELTQTKLQRQITQFQKQIVASQLRPQVQGFATLNLADNLEDRVLGGYGYSVGVQMSMNVFNGGSVRAQLRQLDKNLDVIDQQFNQLKESIRFQVEQAYFSLQANATNIETAKEALKQAQESLRLAEVQRDAGIGTTLGVTTAQANLTQAQGNLIGAILAYNNALVALEGATGFVNIVENP